MKQAIFFLILGFLLVSFSGCNTVKGAAKGAADGFSQDWKEAKKIDDWLQKNAW